MAAKTKEQKLFEQHVKILTDLLKLPGNEICADCSAKGPRWASTNIGIYICIRCSGIHRSLGTHISKVKSTNLDKWTPEQIEYIREIGNTKANQAWEAKFNQAKPNENDTYAVEQFIKEKYVRRRWLDPSLLTPAAREQFDAQTRTSGGSTYTAPHYSSGGRDIFGGGSSSSGSGSRAAPVSRSPPRERHSRHSPPEDSHRSDRRGSGSGSSRSGERSKRRTRDEHSSSSSAHSTPAPAAPAPTPAAPSQPLVQFDAPVAATTTAPPIDAFGAFVSAQSTPAGDFFGATQTGGSEFFGTQAPKKATKDDIMSLFESAPTQPAIASPSSQFGAQVYQHAQSLPAAYVAPQYYAAAGATMVPATAYVAVRPQGYPAVATAPGVQYGYVQPTYVGAPTAYGVGTTPQYGGYR